MTYLDYPDYVFGFPDIQLGKSKFYIWITQIEFLIEEKKDNNKVLTC